MTDTYHDPNDHKFAANLRRGAPEAFQAFLAFDKQAIRGKTKHIPQKYTELMALSVALTTQCAYCIKDHVEAAKKAGASEEEVAETVMIAAALRSGGAAAHGLMAMKFYEMDE